MSGLSCRADNVMKMASAIGAAVMAIPLGTLDTDLAQQLIVGTIPVNHGNPHRSHLFRNGGVTLDDRHRMARIDEARGRRYARDVRSHR